MARRQDARGTDTVLRFSEDDIWIRAEDMQAQVGLADHGQALLGEIIAVELPEVGERIECGAPFGELESVRTVQELKAPVTGVISAVNAELEEHPELVNEDPYHDGWLIEVKLSNESELDDLMPADEYEDFVSGEDG